MPEDYTWEPLSKTARVCVSRVHRFGTDAILLADFSLPRRGERCAELGAGCGVISLLWATRAAPSKVFAVELQEDAAALCRRGVEANGLADAVETVRADLRDTRELRRHFEPGSLDRMACNPPYQSAGTGVMSRDPGERLARHETACSFADVAAAARTFLRWGGVFCCCQRPARLPELMRCLSDSGLEPKRLRFVQQRPGKEPFLFLLEARRGGRPGLRAEPVLFVEGDRGGWSPEILKIYGEYKEGRI